MSFIGELKRRNVLRVGAAYAVVSWLIIQVAGTTFPAFGFSSTAFRAVIVLLVIGFFPTVILAWVFQLTLDGFKLDREVDQTKSISRITARHLDRVIMVVLVLALGYFAVDKFVLTPQRQADLQQETTAAIEQAREQGRTEALVKSYGEKSIAVLPFLDMSTDQDQEYFSDGISEELLNLLAKIPKLRVISRTSAFSFKGEAIEIPDIAEQLNVAHILEGSVRKSGNRIRITAQLIDARSDTHIWSETYDRELEDVFAIQDEIAATVVEKLRITLLDSVPKVQEANPEAYALFLQARHMSRQGTAEAWEQSNALYRKGLEIYPDYPPALVLLSINHMNQVVSGVIPPETGIAAAREFAADALEIDPDYAPAHARLGLLALYFDNDPEGAARHYERALQLDPGNANITANAAILLASLNRLDEAITLTEFTIARNPINAVQHYNLGAIYLRAGRWQDAIDSLNTSLDLSPTRSLTHYAIGEALILNNDAAAAVEEMRQERSAVFRLMGLVMAHYSLGEQETSNQLLAELVDKHGDTVASLVATAQAHRNEVDQAFESLYKAKGTGDPYLSSMVDVPFFKNLHSDPRWTPFLESIGKSPAQLGKIKFEVTIPK